MRDRALALALCGLGLVTGCAGLPHAYRPAQARDENLAGDATPNPETCAILLVPENARLYWGDVQPRRPQSLVDEVVLAGHVRAESHAGPVRLFVAPGHPRYQLEIMTDDGPVDTLFEAELKAGNRYLLEIEESAEQATWSLIRLSDASYAHLYPAK
jgi:hypothetical protein